MKEMAGSQMILRLKMQHQEISNARSYDVVNTHYVESQIVQYFLYDVNLNDSKITGHIFFLKPKI